jgi:3-phenylpropionate/cinnamic acid dioxygenase small subunit
MATQTMEPVLDAAERAMIEDFLIDYAHAIDDGELQSWPHRFTEDGVYKITTRENFDGGLPLGIILCEGRGMMADRIKALETASIFEPHTYCHILGRPRLIPARDGHIQARTNFHEVRTMQDGRSESFAVGKYLDLIAIEGGAPLLRERTVVLDSRRIDILLVYPI